MTCLAKRTSDILIHIVNRPCSRGHVAGLSLVRRTTKCAQCQRLDPMTKVTASDRSLHVSLSLSSLCTCAASPPREGFLAQRTLPHLFPIGIRHFHSGNFVDQAIQQALRQLIFQLRSPFRLQLVS